MKKLVILIVVVIILIGLIMMVVIDKPERSFSLYIQVSNTTDGYVLFPDLVNSDNEPIFDISQFTVKNNTGNCTKVLIDNVHYLNITCESWRVLLFINSTTLPADWELPDNWKSLNYSGFNPDDNKIPVYYSGSNSFAVISAQFEILEDDFQHLNLIPGTSINTGWNRLFNPLIQRNIPSE